MTPTHWHWRHWPVLVKLISVLLVPTAVATVFGTLYAVETATTSSASDAAWVAGILVVGLAASVAVAVAMARAMLGSLDRVRRAALDVADRRLPAAVEDPGPSTGVDPVPVHTRDEIGRVARALDAVHGQAVRLAGEQARQRSSVNEIFVNLSRRSQGLVQRQLSLLETLERGEENPETLDNLFALDHLAARMRRNSESLLVLAGTESARRAGRSEPLEEVLRAAISEVEQYQRLVLRPPPDMMVLGRTAGDLVHLLAELLDNATQFSPPDSQVVIAGRAAGGSLVIEVDDRGVGIGERERAEFNERLASAPAAIAPASRRMGLYVVGRLAARHEIRVALGPGEQGAGTVASVTLPAAVVRTGGDEHGPPGEPVAAAPRDDDNAAPGGQDSFTPDADQPGPNGTPSAAPATEPGADREAATNQSAGPGQGDGAHLFRPAAEPVQRAEPPAPPPVTLQQATPIFDEIISAWFRDPDTPQPGAARHAADAGPEWGSADTGWQAVRALTSPDSGEYTAAGLPRRRPRAHLVPGAAGSGAQPEPGTASRTAESIRGRLASYQRGVRQGRHSRAPNGDDAENGYAEAPAASAEEGT